MLRIAGSALHRVRDTVLTHRFDTDAGVNVFSVEPAASPALSLQAAAFSAACLATIANPFRQDE